MFSAGNLREWRGRFFRPVGWPCRPRCTLAELYLQLQRGESVSLHFFRKAKPLPMDNLRKSGVERELELTSSQGPWAGHSQIMCYGSRPICAKQPIFAFISAKSRFGPGEHARW